MYSKVVAIALAFILVGCVTSSDVIQISDNRYYITAKDKGGVFSGDGKVVSEATEKARSYCQQQGKKTVIEEIDRDPEAAFRFETSDVYFSCQ